MSIMANEMTRYIPTEFSDADGNVRYPHTEASVVFMDDGRRVQAVLARIDALLENIESVSSSSEISGATALVTAAALAEVKKLCTTISSELTKTRMPNSVKIITSGSGASVKYYLQLGADTASKKELCEPTVALASSASANSASGAVSKAYTATQAGKVIAVVMATTGNDSHSAYYGPSVAASATSGSKVSALKNLTAMGYNANLSAASGHAVVGAFVADMVAKGVLTVKITPYESQFQVGYAVMFITL